MTTSSRVVPSGSAGRMVGLALRLLCCGALLGLAMGCTTARGQAGPGPKEARSTEVVLEVAPQRRSCMAMFARMCLVMREVQPGQPLGPWHPWFEEIAGFEHVAGYHYTLRVRKDRLARVPADAADTRYTMLELLDREPEGSTGGNPRR